MQGPLPPLHVGLEPDGQKAKVVADDLQSVLRKHQRRGVGYLLTEGGEPIKEILAGTCWMIRRGQQGVEESLAMGGSLNRNQGDVRTALFGHTGRYKIRSQPFILEAVPGFQRCVVFPVPR